MKIAALLLILSGPLALAAQADGPDIVHLIDGKIRSGRIRSIDQTFLRLEMPSPVPGQPPMILAEPRDRVAAVDFWVDEELEKAIREKVDLGRLESLWKWHAPFLDLPRSPAARLGIAYARALLETGSKTNHSSALRVFGAIEASAWNSDDQAMGRKGRLRTLGVLGRFQEVRDEAEDLARKDVHPGVRCEAALLLGREAAEMLERLLEENPRWEEDTRIRAERHRLYHEAIEWNLLPAVLFGSETEPAARGLWAALELLHKGKETSQAVELARDLIFLHPDTGEAAKATEWLTQLPPEFLNNNSAPEL